MIRLRLRLRRGKLLLRATAARQARRFIIIPERGVKFHEVKFGQNWSKCPRGKRDGRKDATAVDTIGFGARNFLIEFRNSSAAMRAVFDR